VSLADWGSILTALSKVPDLLAQANTNELRLQKLETALATQQEIITRIDTVTNAMADDISTITTKIKALQDAVTSGNSAAISDAMDSLAPSLTTLETTEANLRALGSDQSNPVPNPV
jgi:uncharacterized coiled-coil protein SlyX